MQPRGLSGGRARGRWTTLDWAASVTLSAFWHLLVLAVLTLAVHPFQLPDQNRAISFQFLPPLTPPPMPTVEVRLRPRQTDRTPPPEPRARVAIRPEAQALPQAVEVKPPQPTTQRSLLDVARPSQPELQTPVEVERRAAPAPRLQTRQAAPQIPEAPPEPLQVARPAPALQPPVEVPRAQGRPRALDASRPAPALPEAAAPEAPAPPSQVQVLTSESVVQAPVEIRPRERAPLAPRVTTQPGVADIPAPGGGTPPVAAAAQGGPGAGGAAQGGAGRPSVSDFNGITGLNGAKGGLRTTLGCENPDVYKLTAEERAACLQRFGQRAKDAPDLGLAVAAGKKAQYDSYEACQTGYRRKEGSIPNYDQKFGGSSISGIAPLPKECVPLQNR
jgi:hypothetical protein